MRVVLLGSFPDNEPDWILENAASGPQMVWTGARAARLFSVVYRYLLDRRIALSHSLPGTMAPASTADRN